MGRIGTPGDIGVRDRFVETLAPLLFALSSRLDRHMSEVTIAVGLPPALAMALRRLEPGRPRPMGDLADVLGCDPSNVTGIADRLEALGLVERRASDRDRRVKELVVTEAGAAARARFLELLDRVPVSVDALADGDRSQLLELLSRLLEADTGSDTGADRASATCCPAHEESGAGQPPAEAAAGVGDERGRIDDRGHR